jgi:hypothetical protein
LRERDPASIDRAELVRMNVCHTIASSVSIHDPLLATLFQARYLNMALKTGHVFHAACALASEVAHRVGARRGGARAGRADGDPGDRAGPAARRGLPRGLLALARGIAAFHFGRWQEAIGVLDRAEQILRGECVGAGYEVTTRAGVSPGRAVPARRAAHARGAHGDFIAEARERDDAWADTFLRAGPQVGFWLADDDLPRARAELAYVQQRWPDDAPNVPRLWTFIGGLHVDLYAARQSAAWGRVKREWQELSRSFLFEGQWARVMLHALRAGARSGACTPTTARASARACCARSSPTSTRLKGERTLWATPFVELVHAGLLVVYRQKDRGDPQGLRAAEQGFRAVDMALYAAAARRRCGQLLGGDAGAQLIASADMAMGEQGVRRPERMAGCSRRASPRGESGRGLRARRRTGGTRAARRPRRGRCGPRRSCPRRRRPAASSRRGGCRPRGCAPRGRAASSARTPPAR